MPLLLCNGLPLGVPLGGSIGCFLALDADRFSLTSARVALHDPRGIPILIPKSQSTCPIINSSIQALLLSHELKSNMRKVPLGGSIGCFLALEADRFSLTSARVALHDPRGIPILIPKSQSTCPIINSSIQALLLSHELKSNMRKVPLGGSIGCFLALDADRFSLTSARVALHDPRGIPILIPKSQSTCPIINSSIQALLLSHELKSNMRKNEQLGS
ncbi:UNVERIFIED_CONTAM: hypothetical protein FKN15_010498 [Acipenser sinensis]